MAPSTQRYNREKGARTQALVAEWYQRLWPTANSQSGGARGRDVRGVPADIEVKMRKDFSPLAWLKQQLARGGRLETDVLPPWCVLRPVGTAKQAGPGEDVSRYLVIRLLGDDTAILEELLMLRRRVAELGGLPETQEAARAS